MHHRAQRIARPEKPRAVAYIRVSTDSQAMWGISLEEQQAKISAYASLYDLELVEVVIDAGVSAKTLEREGLQRALAMLARGDAEALIVVKLDRLTRSVTDLGVLVERHFQKAALLSVSEQIDTRSAAGRLVLNVLASVAQWEREAIGERTSAALQHKRAQGQRVGAVPYGYALAADGVHLEEMEAEQEIIRAAREYRAAGLSLRAIASRLADAGATSRNGAPFAATQINRLVDHTHRTHEEPAHALQSIRSRASHAPSARRAAQRAPARCGAVVCH